MAPSSLELDMRDRRSLILLLDAWKPTHVINCAAYTNVDAAENNRELCQTINSDAVASLVKLCAAREIRLSQISTASVFSGPTGSVHSLASAWAPVNWYSWTKVKAERSCIAATQEGAMVQIPRVYWLFDSLYQGFPGLMIKLATESGRVLVAQGQCGQPTYAPTAAAEIVQALKGTDAVGPIHITPSGSASRTEWVREILATGGLESADVVEVDAHSFGAAAVRPTDCTLSWEPADRAGFTAIPWQDGVRRAR